VNAEGGALIVIAIGHQPALLQICLLQGLSQGTIERVMTMVENADRCPKIEAKADGAPIATGPHHLTQRSARLNETLGIQVGSMSMMARDRRPMTWTAH